MKGARTVRKEVAERLNGPGANPPKRSQFVDALHAGDDGDALEVKLVSLATACGILPGRIPAAIEALRATVVSLGLEEDALDDGTVEGFFTEFAANVPAPAPTAKDPKIGVRTVGMKKHVEPGGIDVTGAKDE